MTREQDAKQRMRHKAHNKAIEHLTGAITNAIAAENTYLARSLVSLAAEQAQLWVIAQAMTVRCAAHLHTYQDDTLNGIHFWTEQDMWTFRDVTEMEGIVGDARATAARLVTTVLYSCPLDPSAWSEEWLTIWDSNPDPETVTLALSAMLAHTYPDLRVPTAG